MGRTRLRDTVLYGAGVGAQTLYNLWAASRGSQSGPGETPVVYSATEGRFKMRGRSYTKTKLRKRRQRKSGRRGLTSNGVIGPRIPRPIPVEKPGKYKTDGSFGEDEKYLKLVNPEMTYFGFKSVKRAPVQLHTGYDSSTTAGNLLPAPVSTDGFNNAGDKVTPCDLLLDGISYTARVGTAAPYTYTNTYYSDFEPGSFGYHVAAALLRRILKREFKMDVTDHDMQISVGQQDTKNQTTDSDPGTDIVFIWRNDNLAGGVPTFASGFRLSLWKPGGAYTFKELVRRVSFGVFHQDIFGGVAGTSASMSRSLYGYSVIKNYTPDPNGNASTEVDWKVYQTIETGIKRIDKWRIRGYSRCEVTVQNATLADTVGGDQYEIDRIDSNPLQCRLYKFKGPTPRVRAKGSYDIANIMAGWSASAGNNYLSGKANMAVRNDEKLYILTQDDNGDGLIVPSQPSAIQALQALSPDRFDNCMGMTSFSLAPGEIRKFNLKFKFNGSVNSFIRGFRSIAQDSVIQYNGPGSLGTCCLLTAEKILSTGASTDVTLNIQTCYYAGAVVYPNRVREVMDAYKSVQLGAVVADE